MLKIISHLYVMLMVIIELDYPFETGSIAGIGDNHAGYIGFRNPTNNKILEDDGAMGVVVSNWKNSTVTKKHYSPSVTEC